MDKDVLSVSNSILLGSILIALSIFFSNYYNNSLNNQKVLPSDTKVTKTVVTPRGDAPKEGNGKIVMIEFSDFQCPFCQKFYSETYNQIKKNYIDTGKITFIYRNFPLASLHKNATKAAEAGECANMQGKFWDYHDKLFDSYKQDGSNLEISNLKSFAEELGLDTQKFNNCLDKGQATSLVNSDIKAGQDVDVGATPTFFVDGYEILGAQPYSVFKDAIEKALIE